MGSLNLDKTDSKDDKDNDSDNDENENKDGEPLMAATAVSAVPSPSVLLSVSCGQKHKSIADSIADISAHEWDNQIKIAKINASAKTQCSTECECIKQCTHMKIELVKLQHQHDEAAAQHAHEALMFDKQIALKMAQAGHMTGPSSDNIDPSLR